MRKVKFSEWIPAKYETEGLNKNQRIEGTGIWKEHPDTGLFHQWAAAWEDIDTGPGNYTVALIEMPDGSIREALPSRVRFLIDTDPEQN